jgi:fructokinase
MTAPALISFGEALTDLVNDGAGGFRALCGGAPWNVARACSALGLPSAWAGAISADSFGDALQEASRAAGLDARFIQRIKGRPPLLAVVDRLDPPHYFFIGERSADLAFDPALLPNGWASQARWALFGGISLVREPLGRVLENIAETLPASVRQAFDPNHRALMSPQDLPRLERFVRRASVVKLSDEDLCGYFPGQAPQTSLTALRAGNPQATWLYTQGAGGMTLFAPGQEPISRPPLPVQVVDTVGAGDASMAGLLLALDLQLPPPQQLAHALAAASLACSRAGAAAPTRAELDAALA